MEFSFTNIAILAVASLLAILIILAIFWEKLYNLSRNIYRYAAYAYLIVMISTISMVIYRENRDSINNAIHFVIDKMLFVSGLAFIALGIFGTCHLVRKYAPEAKNNEMIEKRDKALLIIGVALGFCNLFLIGFALEIDQFSGLFHKIDDKSRELGFADGLSTNFWLALTCWTAVPYLISVLKRYIKNRKSCS